MKILILTTLIFSLFLTSLGLAQNTAKEAELLFMARKAYEDGFYEVSLGMLERFQKEYPDQVKVSEADLLSGQCYFQQGRFLEALNVFERLIKTPQNTQIKDALYFWLAEVHFKGGNFDKATGYYEKLIKEFPQSAYTAAAYYSLGWSFSALGKYTQAVQIFKTLLDKFPTEPQSKDAAFKLVECLYNLKEYAQLKDKALPLLKLYTKDQLRLAYLYFYLAEAEYYLDEFEQASQDYLKCVQISKEPNVQALANLGLGWSYLKLEKYKEAEAALAGIKQNILDKKSLDTLFLGQALLMSLTNRIYEAKQIYERLMKTSNDDLICIQAYLGKAEALVNLAEYSQAVQVYQEGLEKIKRLAPEALPPELVDKIYYNLGLAYIKTGKINLGEELFEELKNKNNHQSLASGLLFQVGQAYEEANDAVGARRAYLKILELYPHSDYADYAQFQLGLLSLRSGEFDLASNALGQVLERYPQSKLRADASYSLGTVYFQQGDFQKSIETFLKFQNEFKDSSLSGQAAYMQAVALINLGKLDLGLAILKETAKHYMQDPQLLPKVEYAIADCYARLGQEGEAFKLFKLLRAKYPNSEIAPDVLWWLGRYYYRNNDPALARRYFDALIKDPQGGDLIAQAFYALGLTYTDEGKNEQAQTNFKKAIQLGDIDLKAQSILALAKNYNKSGDYQQAKVFYQQILDQPNFKDIAKIRFDFAETLEANLDFDNAIKQYLFVADLPLEELHLSAKALLRVGKIYEDKENFKQALKIYQRLGGLNCEEAKFAQERIDAINLRK